MLIDLSGKSALVTGSTQGIGAAIALGLARAGAEVGINGRTAERVDESIAWLQAKAPLARFVPVPGNMADQQQATAVAELLPDFDILINNLGIFGSADPLSIDDAEWKRYFDTNVLSAVRLTRLYLPAMMTKGWGRILNIASDSAVVTPAEMIHYGMSKTALLAVSRGFAKAAAGTGVTVNSVLAGPTHTDGVEDFVYELVPRSLSWEEAERQFMLKYRPQSLLQRLIEPEEIANMVVYLASPVASATTGAAVRVDGGYIDSIVP
ncbi:SDR family NAD(P)-dependent oxidoreductase [Frondihabitans australicus]|uniref:NAD(P)-dependent dehydrogenase (Short-subunit alcohol dehydrogenase family) n=1 Tax=Frondihabitans australicus TaxID=386892 RepID=A0A495IMF9_9MICO|nr:SDR family oxidoreductase [Frondihabitans australicus]RKR76346.1 NAD(P)-dependent dehydrogenase (short-subunit alcohol dehydrogenase family) [Frondihabitans australicus]